jgi:uncharacterized membrane protein YgcG
MSQHGSPGAHRADRPARVGTSRLRGSRVGPGVAAAALATTAVVAAYAAFDDPQGAAPRGGSDGTDLAEGVRMLTTAAPAVELTARPPGGRGAPAQRKPRDHVAREAARRPVPRPQPAPADTTGGTDVTGSTSHGHTVSGRSPGRSAGSSDGSSGGSSGGGGRTSPSSPVHHAQDTVMRRLSRVTTATRPVL